MKPTIIQLAYDDTVASIKAKIENSPTQRVLLVWPDFDQLNLRTIDYLIILRHAYHLDVQIAFVLDDPGAALTLKEYGISTFRTIPEAQKKPWRKPKLVQSINKNYDDDKNDEIRKYLEENRKKNRKTHPVYQWIFFVIGIIAFLALILFIIPSTTIKLSPNMEEITITIPVRADNTVQQMNITGYVPVKVVEIDVESKKEGTSSGSTRISDTFATGEVIFRNLSDKSITIPEGTVVRTNGDSIVRFETTKSVLLPQEFGSEIHVPVQSLISGAIGNVSALEITVIEGDFGANLAVSNPELISGGVDRKTFSPTERDFQNLKDELIEELTNLAYEQILDEYGENFLIQENTIVFEEIILEEKIPEIGEPGERFTLRIQARYSAWLLDRNDLLSLSNLVLDTKTNETFQPVIGSTKYFIDEPSIKFQEQELNFNLTASQQVYPFIDELRIKQLITGKRTVDAIKILENEIKLESTPEVSKFPTFWDFMPLLSFRINLELRE